MSSNRYSQIGYQYIILPQSVLEIAKDLTQLERDK